MPDDGNPAVFTALNPEHGVRFFLRNGVRGFLVLGSVFLVVTGGEALYADMGHFGRRPIRITWFTIVLPALLLNYYGQGAMVIARPETLEQPFYLMAPGWALLPLVGLTTVATVIASQAVISGAFSLTRQAVQLGYLPRMRIFHTSEREIGQIYVSGINWLLMVASIGLVLGFRSSSRLAAAYGVAVTTDMVFTTVLFAYVALRRFRWPNRLAQDSLLNQHRKDRREAAAAPVQISAPTGSDVDPAKSCWAATIGLATFPGLVRCRFVRPGCPIPLRGHRLS